MSLFYETEDSDAGKSSGCVDNGRVTGDRCGDLTRVRPDTTVVLGGRDRQALAELAATLPSARTWPVIIEPAHLTNLIPDLRRLECPRDSAAICELGRVGETEVETWRRSMNVNRLAVAELTKAHASGLFGFSWASRILIKSSAGHRVVLVRGLMAPVSSHSAPSVMHCMPRRPVTVCA